MTAAGLIEGKDAGSPAEGCTLEAVVEGESFDGIDEDGASLSETIDEDGDAEADASTESGIDVRSGTAVARVVADSVVDI